jgi:hypothetical protein
MVTHVKAERRPFANLSEDFEVVLSTIGNVVSRRVWHEVEKVLSATLQFGQFGLDRLKFFLPAGELRELASRGPAGLLLLLGPQLLEFGSKTSPGSVNFEQFASNVFSILTRQLGKDVGGIVSEELDVDHGDHMLIHEMLMPRAFRRPARQMDSADVFLMEASSANG